MRHHLLARLIKSVPTTAAAQAIQPMRGRIAKGTLDVCTPAGSYRLHAGDWIPREIIPGTIVIGTEHTLVEAPSS